MLAAHTERARSQLQGPIVAAVPSRTVAPAPGLVAVGVVSGASSLIEPLLGFFAPLVIIVREYVGRFRTRHAEAAVQGQYRPMLLVFRDDRVDIHATSRAGRRIGPALESHPLQSIEYRRANGVLDTRVEISDGASWAVHGWFERDLRALIGPLGVRLGELTEAA